MYRITLTFFALSATSIAQSGVYRQFERGLSRTCSSHDFSRLSATEATFLPPVVDRILSFQATERVRFCKHEVVLLICTHMKRAQAQYRATEIGTFKPLILIFCRLLRRATGMRF